MSGLDTVAHESLVKPEALRRLDGVEVDREELKEIKVVGVAAETYTVVWFKKMTLKCQNKLYLNAAELSCS